MKSSVIISLISNKNSPFEIINSQITIKKSFIGLKKIWNSSVIANLDKNSKYSLTLLITLWIHNQSKKRGSCISLTANPAENSKNNAILYKNIFILNRSFQGGVIIALTLNDFLLKRNKVVKNQVISGNYSKRAKGGFAFFGVISSNLTQKMCFKVELNIFHENKAEIGGIFYF